MTAVEYCVFNTAVGRCAILWRGMLLQRVLLPAADEGRLVALVRRIDPQASAAAPPAALAAVVDGIIALCSGQSPRFDDAPVDRALIEPFAGRVYAALAAVGFGETTTYGAIAEQLGDKGLARAVGAALGANPFPIVIPCHRVTASGGAIGGFSAPGGAETKRRLLEIEGAFALTTLPLFRAGGRSACD